MIHVYIYFKLLLPLNCDFCWHIGIIIQETDIISYLVNYISNQTITKGNINIVKMFCPECHEKSLKIPKGQSESVYRRRTDNTMAK